MSDFLIGIDGGASGSRAVLVDSRDRLIHAAEGRGLNPLAVGWDEFDKNLSKLLGSLRRGAALKEVRGLCAGLAGVGDQRVRERACKIAAGLLPHVPIHIITDAEAALWGAFRGEPGLLLIAGTGSICLGMNVAGKTARSGGFGRILGDEGSGYWISMQAIKLALHQADRGVRSSSLMSAVCSHFGLREIREIVPLYYSPKLAHEKVAQLVPKILALSGTNSIARRIIQLAGDHLAELLVNTARKLRMERPQVALWGGLWNSKGRELQEALRYSLRRRKFICDLTTPRRTAAWGAVYYLKCRLH
jgi:N-acetylglucosamine kinase-like BadF-type ATPase